MKHHILVLILFCSCMAACQKETPKTQAQIIGRYAVAVEHRYFNAIVDTTVFYNDTVTITAATQSSINVQTSVDNTTLQTAATGSSSSLKYEATDSAGTSFSALFFSEKTIQLEVSTTQNGRPSLRKHLGEKVSN